MQASQAPALEEQLLADMASIDQRISELAQERRAIERMLLRVRQSKVKKDDVSRKNSINRIVAEKIITDKMAALGNKPISSSEITMILSAYNPGIKHATVRSYLHRMKLRGTIKNPGGKSGLWILNAP